MSWKIVVYFEDLAFGGHEEGGWYYGYGIPVSMQSLGAKLGQFKLRFKHGRRVENITIGMAPNGAYREMKRVQRWLDRTVNKDLPEISSVLSEGRYRADVVQGKAKPYPEYAPHYE